MRAPECKRFSNISATTDPFSIYGGVYDFAVIGSNFGTVTLSVLGPDGTTYITAATAISANGRSGAIALAPGQYRIAISSATAVYATLTRIPGD